MHKRMRALMAGVLLAVASTGVAYAADPTAPPTPVSQTTGGSLVGIHPGTDGKTPEQLGYTQAYADSKTQALYAQAPTGLGPLAVSGSLSGYPQYHQKTTHWCLAAVLQSVLKYKFSNGWIVPSITAKQQTIDGLIIGSDGTEWESNALPWVNGEFASHNSSFRWITEYPTSWSQMALLVEGDVSTYGFPTYVGVDVGSPYYVWHQNNHVHHATAAVGYSSSGAVAQIADPYTSPTWGPAYCNTGVSNPTWSATPDYGCIYSAWDMSKYYSAASTWWY